MKKKLGSEKKYVSRYVWLDSKGTGRFYWAKSSQKDESASKNINIMNDSILSVLHDTNEWGISSTGDGTGICTLHIMMAPDVVVAGSSKNIGGAKDSSIDISFNIMNGDMSDAELLFSGLVELL